MSYLPPQIQSSFSFCTKLSKGFTLHFISFLFSPFLPSFFLSLPFFPSFFLSLLIAIPIGLHLSITEILPSSLITSSVRRLVFFPPLPLPPEFVGGVREVSLDYCQTLHISQNFYLGFYFLIIHIFTPTSHFYNLQ